MTRAPTSNRVTPGPSFATSPAASVPAGLAAAGAPMNSPRLSPAALTRTSICSGPGSGSAASLGSTIAWPFPARMK